MSNEKIDGMLKLEGDFYGREKAIYEEMVGYQNHKLRPPFYSSPSTSHLNIVRAPLPSHPLSQSYQTETLIKPLFQVTQPPLPFFHSDPRLS